MKPKSKPPPESPLPLKAFRLRNFKAIQDSGEVHFTPLTVLIGNNGVGKSAIIEGLETFKDIALHGLDEAFLPWRGFEHIWNKAVRHDWREDQVGRRSAANPMRFEINARIGEMPFTGALEIAADEKGNKVFIAHEGFVTSAAPPLSAVPIPAKEPQYRLRDYAWREYLSQWQFLNLDPRSMLDPKPEQRSAQEIRLAKDGSNIAQYLQSIAVLAPAVLDGIAETVKTVLPYASDLRPAITKELQRSVYLRLYEKGVSREQVLPGWLLSQGTLRMVAFLAVLRHPKPPAVVFIEELENGLDFRTLQMLVEEIRQFVNGTGRQVVATTHSPYLLDLLPLSQVVLVDRTAKGPRFWRPTESAEVKKWAEDYGPGSLYTMGRLQPKAGR